MKLVRALALCALACVVASAQVNLMPMPHQQFFDVNGYPLAAGLLYTYQAGTSTPLATYKDSAGLVPNTNPIVLDSGGFGDVWLSSTAYKFVLKNSLGVTIWTADNVSPRTNYSASPFQTMTYLANTVVGAPIRGTPTAPITGPVPPILAQISGSTNGQSGDPSIEPAAIKGFAYATTPGGQTSNVIGVLGAAETHGGCGGPCAGNAVGGIGVAGFGHAAVASVATWGGWFAAWDHGLNSGTAGVEIDMINTYASRGRAQARGLQLINANYTGNVGDVGNDWGALIAGFGKGIVFQTNNTSATGTTHILMANDSQTDTANTTVMAWEPGQTHFYKTGIDFSNVSFTDSAIKSPTISRAIFLNGIGNSSGLKHMSACASSCDIAVTPCTTGASAGASCSFAVPFPAGFGTFADTAYHPTCTAVAPTGVPMLYITNKTTTGITVQFTAATAAAATATEIDCIAIHN
jgi:hypothetical protein